MKTEVSKHLLGKMTSKESTENVIKEVAVEFTKWTESEDVKIVFDWEDNNEVIFYTLSGVHSQTVFSREELFDYWIDNIFKIN